MASFGLIVLNFDNESFKKGPPEAVMNTFSILLSLFSFSNDQIEKCSESMGINLVLYFFKLF